MVYRMHAPDFAAELEVEFKAVEKIHTEAMRDLVEGLADELRDQVREAGLGERLARTWSTRVYPERGASLGPAGFVSSKAAAIIGTFETGATILPQGGGGYLAIPTQNVPLKRGARRMTPADVKAHFGQELIIRRGRRAGQLLAFVNVVASKNKRGWRRATPGRLAQGRGAKLVLMFTLVRSVRLAKRLDADGAVQRWAAKYDAYVQIHWDRYSVGRGR